MRRSFLLVPLVLIVLGAVAVLWLGAFPPAREPQPVQRVLPNDQFKPN